ncbi:MAG: prepilin peptidase [Halarcobacter sp.]
MIFSISFYIFSLFISYIDCKKRLIPNTLLLTLTFFLLIFGYLENKLHIYSFLVLLLILLFFVIIVLIVPKMILGGGDIKYFMVVAIYLQPLYFPLFLLFCGIFQFILLIYFQNIKKRRTAPMAPAIIFAVFITEIVKSLEIYL